MTRTAAIMLLLVSISEVRLCATDFFVDSLGDNPAMNASDFDGKVTLREAVIAANTNQPFGDAPAGSGPDRIQFRFRENHNLTIRLLDEIEISETVTIRDGVLSLEGNRIEISGQDQCRIFRVASEVTLYLYGVNLSNGAATEGGLIYSDNGRLQVQHVDLSSGTAAKGGAIRVFGGSCFLTNCTLRENFAEESGGAIHADGSMYVGVKGCTLTANHAIQSGGAIAVDPDHSDYDGHLSCESLTIVGNTVGSPWGNSFGAGIAFTNTPDWWFDNISLLNCIVANNCIVFSNGQSVVDDVHVGKIFQARSNLIGYLDSIHMVSNGASGNQVGTQAQPINPRLSSLAFNSGRTLCFMPRANSAAVNRGGDVSIYPSSTDQRGANRLRGKNVDIGSVER